MIRHKISSALTFLVLVTGTSLFDLSSPNPIIAPGDVRIPHKDTSSGLTERKDESERSTKQEEAEEEDELFKDVDPKMLAAVLLEAMNNSQAERRREREGERNRMEQEDQQAVKAELEEVRNKEAQRQVRTMEGSDRDRDGRQKLELLMATQGKEREREEEEEQRKAQEEEDKMTEKVTSRTTSQIVQLPVENRPAEGEAAIEQGLNKSPEKENNEEEEEEQLSPEELKSLETMMKEFPRLNAATKREGESDSHRESRGYSTYNDVLPIHKGSDLSMSKKKLKWQEETQKGLNVPTFRGGNFMDDFDDGNYVGNNAAQSQLPSKQENIQDDEPEDEEEEEEEVLSPEEEEVRAKAEQDEMRRQAAEAQRAKMEEKKLADIASDMLLRYMVKQNSGNKKYALSNAAAEDKRSDEEQEVAEQDDIDPQTIDKLIEISSKLHLPADDVVDIISDVEKKKKKDLPAELTFHRQQPLTLSSSSSSSANGFSPSWISTNQNRFPVSEKPPTSVNLLKTWFQEKSPTKWQDLRSRPENPFRASQSPWSKLQKPLSTKQESWLKSPKSIWDGTPKFYPYTYPSYYQRKPYPYFYPNYFTPPTRPNPRYYVQKPALTLNNLLDRYADDANTFPPKRRYQSWVQPRLRNPPVGRQQKPYYHEYPALSLYPKTFQPLSSIPKPRSPLRLPVIPPQQKQFYHSAPALLRNEGYYVSGKQPDHSNRDALSKYIQQILKSPQMFE